MSWGVPVIRAEHRPHELYACDELLLCGTGAQVSPVVELDRRCIGTGAVGAQTRRVQQIYFAAYAARSRAIGTGSRRCT